MSSSDDVTVVQPRARALTQRALRIAQWLENNPASPAVSELCVLYHYQDAWEMCARYPVDEVVSARFAVLGVGIDDTLRGIANEMRARVQARVCWYADNGKEWVGLPLIVQPDNPEDERPQLDGSHLSYLKQAQTAMDSAQRLAYGMVSEVIGYFKEHVQTQAEVIQTLRGERAQLQSELDEANDRAAEAEEMATEVMDQAEEATAAAEEAVEQAENNRQDKVLRLVAQGLGAPLPGGGTTP